MNIPKKNTLYQSALMGNGNALMGNGNGKYKIKMKMGTGNWEMGNV